MTTNDIIRMAREAGIDAESDTLCRHGGWVEPIERFAAAVREEFALECIDLVAFYGGPVDLEAAIRARGETK
jgi:hypothetical protein